MKYSPLFITLYILNILATSGSLFCQDRNIGLPKELFYSLTSDSVQNIMHSSTTPLDAIELFIKEFGALLTTSKASHESYRTLETKFIQQLFFKFPLLLDVILQNNGVLTPKAYIVNSSTDIEKEFVEKINTMPATWKNKLSVIALSLVQDKQLKALRYLYYSGVNYIKLNDSVIKYVTDNIGSLNLADTIFLPRKHLSELIVRYGMAENLAKLYENKIINLSSLLYALEAVNKYIEIKELDYDRYMRGFMNMDLDSSYSSDRKILNEQTKKKKYIDQLRANKEFLGKYIQKINQ